MDDAALVGIAEGARQRGEHTRRLAGGHLAAKLLFEGPAGQVFHHQVGHAVCGVSSRRDVGAVIVHTDDVGMRKLRQRLGLALEALEELRRGLVALQNNLEGHMAFQARVEGFINRRHAARAELRDDLVAVDHLPDQLLRHA